MTHLYRYQNQLLFLTALPLSAFGYKFIYFIMTLHIYDLSSSALNIGIFTSLTYVPRLFSTLTGGLPDQLGKAKCFSFSAVMADVLLLIMSFLSDISFTSLLENTKKDVRFIAENKAIRTLAAIAFFWRHFLGMQLSLFVIYIKTGLGATSAQYGF